LYARHTSLQTLQRGRPAICQPSVPSRVRVQQARIKRYEPASSHLSFLPLYCSTHATPPTRSLPPARDSPHYHPSHEQAWHLPLLLSPLLGSARSFSLPLDLPCNRATTVDSGHQVSYLPSSLLLEPRVNSLTQGKAPLVSSQQQLHLQHQQQ
jgi:hypothetical protein